MKQLFSVLAMFCGVMSSVYAQEATKSDYSECSQWYDIQTVKTIEGTISMVKQISTTKDMTFGTHLLVDHKGEKLEIHLGPSWYLEKKKIELRTGEKVKVLGSLCNLEDKPSMIARWLFKQNDTIHLRDDKGFPKWAKKGKNKKGGRNRRYKS